MSTILVVDHKDSHGKVPKHNKDIRMYLKTKDKPFIPFPAGTIRGPFESSKGNPMPYQACYRLESGEWVYFFGKTAEGVVKLAEEYKASQTKL